MYCIVSGLPSSNLLLVVFWPCPMRLWTLEWPTTDWLNYLIHLMMFATDLNYVLILQRIRDLGIDSRLCRSDVGGTIINTFECFFSLIPQ